eukprot:g1459.t1
MLLLFFLFELLSFSFALKPCSNIDGDYIAPPCVWPNQPPSSTFQPSWSKNFNDIAILGNSTNIKGFGADTFYPAEDRTGRLFSGYDDGSINGKDGSNSYMGEKSNTGSLIVTGNDWRNLTVTSLGLVTESAAPIMGRYTSANLFINGTWWVGSYGGWAGDKLCQANLNIPQLCYIAPFVGFRWSRNEGKTWNPPTRGAKKEPLTMTNTIFREKLYSGIKFGAIHIVDHGAENKYSPDGYVYAVGGGCLSKEANSFCSWISGDAIFLTRAHGFTARDPASINDDSNWEYWKGGEGNEWTSDVHLAQPVLKWPGRVGTVTATWSQYFRKYIFAVTTPTVEAMPSTLGPYDTYILEADTLHGPFSLISYLPKFGQQAYFVNFPSKFMNKDEAVMTFSANFACKTNSCRPNIAGAGYGANMLPIRFIKSKHDKIERIE